MEDIMSRFSIILRDWQEALVVACVHAVIVGAFIWSVSALVS
jgi:hypothetical protein